MTQTLEQKLRAALEGEELPFNLHPLVRQLVKVAVASKTFVERHKMRDNDYIPSIRDCIEAEENLLAQVAEMEALLGES